MNDEQFRQWMECCRPSPEGESDAEWSALREAAAEDPERARQLQAVWAWDAAVARAMREVPVPDGLADRLLDVTAQAEKTFPQQLPTSVGREAWWRRAPARWCAIAMSLAALIALFVHLAGWNDTLTGSHIAPVARGWIAQLDLEAWQYDAPPSDHDPVDAAVRCTIVGWQRFPVWGDDRAVVYQGAVAPDRSRAYLFVIRTRNGRRLPSQPPPTPDSTTGNLCIGCWKSGQHLYVLVVPGTRQLYGRVVRSQALAMAAPISARPWQVP